MQLHREILLFPLQNLQCFHRTCSKTQKILQKNLLTDRERTFLAEDALVVEVATLADGPAVRGDADAAMLARIVLFTRVRRIAPDTLRTKEDKLSNTAEDSDLTKTFFKPLYVSILSRYTQFG